MPKTNCEKMHVKPESCLYIVGDTDDERRLLDPLPDGVTKVNTAQKAEIAVIFTTSRADLDKKADAHLDKLRGSRATWVAYPKGGKADINRDSIWRRAEELGWTLSGNISLSEKWSAVRIKPQT